MQNFSELFDVEYVKRLRDLSVSATSTDVKRVIASGEAKNFEDFAILLSPIADKFLEEMALISRNITQKFFGKTIRMFAPLYLSNDCVNNCKYCGFARRHNIERKTLSFDEVKLEIDALYNLGFRNVLLVAAENPKLVSSGYIEECIRIGSKKVPSISLEIAPSSVDDYKRFVSATCEGLTVFQETYDKDVYKSMHPSGPKSNFEYRLDTPDRAGLAEIRNIGLGALYGLNDWIFETIALAMHAKHLYKSHWRSRVGISLPRMRPAESNYVSECKYIPSDRAIVKIMCALRMFISRVQIVVSTRESEKFRDNVIGLGVTQMSAESRTKPGGYAKSEDGGEQFCINDARTAKVFSDVVRSKGYDVVWKDFDNSFMVL